MPVMYFADTAPDIGNILTGYGLAGVVIFALAGVCVYLYRKLDSIQEKRLADAKETRDKIGEPLEKIASVTDKTNDLLIEYITSKRRR